MPAFLVYSWPLFITTTMRLNRGLQTGFESSPTAMCGYDGEIDTRACLASGPWLLWPQAYGLPTGNIKDPQGSHSAASLSHAILAYFYPSAATFNT